LIRVVNSADTNNYNLKPSGLYSFNLKLTEAGA